jgi:pilus assembly protein CpaE
MGLFDRSSMGDTDDAAFVAVVRDEDSRKVLDAFVQGSALPSALVETGGMDDIIRYLVGASRAPRQLLVDISGYDMPLSELERLAEVCDPSVQVYVIGTRNDVGLYRSLLALGVQDYMVKPLTPDLVRRFLAGSAGAGGMTPKLRSGKVIACIGTRGGVGVTTIATHLSRALLEGSTRRRVAFVDLDLRGGAAATMLGLPPSNALGEVLENSARLDPQYLERTLATQDSRLFLLGAVLGHGDAFDPPRQALADVIAALASNFHYVVVDIPHSAGPLAEEAMSRTHIAYVVSDLSVHSTQRLASLLPYCENRDPAPVTYLLLNAPGPNVSARVERHDFASLVRHPVAQDFPHDPEALAEAENLGHELPSSAPFRHAVSRLADMLTGTATAASQQASSRHGWTARLPRWLGGTD